MRKLLLLACPLLLSSSGLWASTVQPDCASGTLNTYLTLSGGCMIGNLLFSNFTFNAAGDQPLPDQNAISVSLVTTGGDGLTFSGAFERSLNETMNIAIGFTVTAPSAIITGDTLTIGGATVAPPGTVGSVAVAENLCVGGSFSSAQLCSAGSSAVQNMMVWDSQNPSGTPPSSQLLTNSVSFAATSMVGVDKNIQILAGSGDTAAVSFVVNTFTGPGIGGISGSQVPEPASFLTLGSGLLFAGLLLRRKIRNS